MFTPREAPGPCLPTPLIAAPQGIFPASLIRLKGAVVERRG